ncbi:hypothetical protein GCM10023190_14290 [Enteractinococcus fodinae]
MLVVANQEHFPTHYDPAAGSAKEKKAHEYRLAGQQIDFVPAQQALAMLATNVEEPEDVVADVPEPVVESPALKPSEVILPTPPLIRHQCQLAHVPAASGVLGFLLRSFDQ